MSSSLFTGGGVPGSSSSKDSEFASLSSLSFVDDGEFLLPLPFTLLSPDFPGLFFRGTPLCRLPCGATFLFPVTVFGARGPILPALTGVPALGVPGVVEGRASPLECVGMVPIPPVNFCRFCEAAEAPWEASRCCRLRRSAAADGVVGVEAEAPVLVS